MMVINASPFGGKTRTAVLLALQLLTESHPRELARLLDAGLSGVQQALRRLEADGLVAGRIVGPSKLYRINPRYFAYKDLQKYLLRLTEPEERLKVRVESLRRRPRRTGKPLGRSRGARGSARLRRALPAHLPKVESDES